MAEACQRSLHFYRSNGTKCTTVLSGWLSMDEGWMKKLSKKVERLQAWIVRKRNEQKKVSKDRVGKGCRTVFTKMIDELPIPIEIKVIAFSHFLPIFSAIYALLFFVVFHSTLQQSGMWSWRLSLSLPPSSLAISERMDKKESQGMQMKEGI